MGAVSDRVARRRRTGDRGATIVEFALAFPVLVLLLMGIIDFGLNYSNKVQIANASRSASRSGAMTNPGTVTNCALRYAVEPVVATKALMCNAKARTNVDPARMAVKVMYMGPTGKRVDVRGDVVANQYSVIVCVSVEVYSVTGLLSPLLSGRFQHSRAVTKTGTYKPNAPQVEPGEELPLVAGGVTDNWNWCTADDPNGTET